MKQLSPIQYQLLEVLGDGTCHSGNALGQVLKVSRTAIWKQINQLIAAGIPINRHAHKGYQLNNPLKLLDLEAINKHLTTNQFPEPFNVHLFSTIDSTNRYLKELPKSQNLEICCAEQQTQGRGRFDRQWHSPFGENIYFSGRWSLHCDLNKLSGLSLVISLATLAMLKELSPNEEIKVKWPNDILWQDKKLCGSLIEIQAESNGQIHVIIGIGLNVNSDTKNNPLPDKRWCSLYEIQSRQFDRNLLIANLLIKLQNYLTLFINNGLASFIEEWNKSDYLAGKQITVTQSGNSIVGTALGINPQGQLLLKDEQGIVHHLSSGDTTLKTK